MYDVRRNVFWFEKPLFKNETLSDALRLAEWAAKKAAASSYPESISVVRAGTFCEVAKFKWGNIPSSWRTGEFYYQPEERPQRRRNKI